jgi:predicted alpha/beta superfamily hydrolase
MTSEFRYLALGIWMAAALGCVQTTEPSDPMIREAAIGGTENHRLRSEHVDQVFSIDVWVPIGMPGPHPVVYALDGNGYFGLAAQTVGPQIFGRELPPMILVGIGYEIDSPMEVVALRTRDLLPTDVEGFAQRMTAQGTPLPDGVRPGGADAFLTFINQELKPFIEARYSVNVEDQTLVGDSYGGTFATHVLLNSTDSFDRYVIGSPVAQWDDDFLFDNLAAYAKEHDALPVTLFMSAGGLEIENGILDSTSRMIAAIEAEEFKDLELTTYIFPDETHTSVIGATLSRGLRAVFGTWPVSAPGEAS